jgi:hypothetical protein
MIALKALAAVAIVCAAPCAVHAETWEWVGKPSSSQIITISPINIGDNPAPLQLGDPGTCSAGGKSWPARWMLECSHLYVNGKQTCRPQSQCLSIDMDMPR